MMTAPASRPDSKEDLSELAGTRPTPVKLQVNQQNQTVTRPSKTMSTSGAPGLAADEVAGDVNERTSDIATPSRDGSSRGSTSSSSSSTTTTMRPVEHQTNSTLHEEDHKEQGSNKEDEQTDLETSGTELSSKKHHQANDSTEAQENRLSSVVADPNEEDPQFGAASSNGTMSKSDDMMDENEPDLVDFDSDDEQQQLSRRLFLSKHNKPNSVADEFKRLKNQGSKLLAKNPLKRKKSKKKAKPMRPRLGTTTVDYGNMISAYSNNHHHHHHHGGLPAGSPLNSQVSATNAISNTIRQHFPAMLANPTQQLSTTVQKLIMSKLSPSASNQQAQTVLAGLQGKRPLHNHAQLMAPNHGLYQQHQPGSYLDNARIVEALSQLASSNEDSSPMGFASSANHKPHIQASLPLGAQQQGNKMIPIEIIGLDPTVTNNILQSYDSEQGATGVGQSAPPLGDPMQVYPGHHEPAIYHHQDSSGQQALAQQLQQLQAAKAADGSSKSFPRASSILHIHHFHTPPSKAGGGPQAQLVAGAEADQQEPGGMRAPSPQQQAPQRVVANGKTTQQKVYINDKGQVVYLSVEDQSEGKGQAGGEQPQPDGSAGEQAQLQAMSDGHETRPGGDTGGQLSEQQQQEYQQAQQEYAQAPNGLQVETDQQHQVDASSNQQEPQQVETISLANGDQPMGLQANGVFKTLLNPLYGGQQQLVYRNMSKLGEPRQKVYLASKGHAISLIGGRENDGLPAGEGESGEKQQLLMVSYKPQQQIRNVTDDLLPGQRNPYNEGQESKPSFIAANHLLAGAPQLLKGSSLMLRPFQSQLTSGRFGSPFFVNNSGSAMDDFNYDLMRLRQQQQSLNLSDIMARLNGTHSLGADLAHLDALRTASPTSESIPLTIVPIHQAANTSYQLGAQLQSGRLSPQENRVPFQTSPALKALISDMANNNIHPALLAANHSRPIELASVQSSWLVPDMMDKLSASLQSNGYNAKAALSAITALRNNGTMFGGSSLTSPSSQNFLIENLTFLKHLRELKERLKQANAESDPQLISHHHLLSLNSTNKLSNDDLLSLINGLRLNNGSTTSINLTQQLQPHSSLPIIESFQAPSGLASLEPIARPNKFGLPQSSSPAPQLARPPLHAITLPVGASSALDGSIQNNNSKHIRSKIGSSNSANLSSAHTGLINNDHHQRNQQHQRSNGHNNKDHRTAMESQQSDVSVDRPMPPTPGQMDKHHPQVISMISDDSEFASDNNGLGTIALAFIFISLITLTLLAASMIYRHKRRSVGRCADLPSRSRLNLTQRTKHFVRSNFVNPGDVTSIKSVNGLDSGGSSSSPRSIQKRSLPSQGKVNGLLNGKKSSECEMRIGSPATNSARTASENRYLAKKPFGQPSLSTFNTTPQLVANSDKYHFSSNSSKQSSETVTDSATDIKTLNTRLQKPPYLKSLISTPDCLLWNKRQQAQSNASNRSDCDTETGTAFDLNIRNRPGSRLGAGSKQGGLKGVSSPLMSDASCKLSPSFKKPDGSETSQHRHHQYGSPSKEIASQLVVGAAGSRQQTPNELATKQSAYSNRSRPSSTMSTIHSIRDSTDSKSGSSSPPNQIKRQVNMVGRMGKLNNLPAPKHLVVDAMHGGSAAADERNSGSNQIDRL